MLESNHIYLGDCLKLMQEIETASVDMILCDLPYGTTACKWDTVIPFEPLWEQYKRISKGAIVLTAREPFTSLLVMSNIKMYHHKWVWNKKQSGSFQNAKYMPLPIEEDIVVFSVGKCPYFPIMRTGVMRDKGGRKTKNELFRGLVPGFSTRNNQYYPVNIIELVNKRVGAGHPTQKPVALFEYLIRTYTNVGDVVVDNCLGSGTTAVACIRTGRRFIGIEIDETYFLMAQKRIDYEQAQYRMAI